MKPTAWRIFLGLTLLVWGGVPPQTSAAAAGGEFGLRVSLRADGLDLDWRPSALQIGLNPDGSTRFSGLDGCLLLDQPGQPALPVCRRLLAVPPGASPQIEISQIDEEDLPLPPGAWIAAVQSPLLQPDGAELLPAPISFSGDYAPTQPLSLERIGRVRGIELARLTFSPIQLHAGRLTAVRRLQARLVWAVGAVGADPRVRPSSSLSSSSSPPSPDPLISSIQGQVLNPTQVSPLFPLPTAADAPSSGPRAAVEVSKSGITVLTYEALRDAGFLSAQPPLDPHLLRLTRAGSEIAMEWEGDDDALFEPGERFLFYADPRFSRYTSRDVYFLELSAAPVARMASQPAAPFGLPAGTIRVSQVFEQNLLYTPDCNCAPIPPGRDGDRWVWDELRPDRGEVPFYFDLPDAAAGQPARLTLWMIGYTDVYAIPTDHKVAVSLNGTPLPSFTFEGKSAVAKVFDVVLNPGRNTLILSLPGGLPGVSAEGAWLDAFRLDYTRSAVSLGNQVRFSGSAVGHSYTLGLEDAAGARAYELSAPDQPVRLSGLQVGFNTVQLGDLPGASAARDYVVSAEAGLLAPYRVRLVSPLLPVSGAKELIIAPLAWFPNLAPLVSLRQSQGLSVVVQDVQAIYDAASGRPEPDAIRAYLSQVYVAWDPRPVDVLLVGDGTADPKQYLKKSSQTWIPPYLADVDPLAGETAADNRYVTVDGGGDILPDFLLGRLPVNSAGELDAVVSKLVQAELAPAPGAWRQAMLFVSDNTDSAGNFPAEANAWIQEDVRSPQLPLRLYYDPAVNNVQAFHLALMSQWQAGARVIVYHGHSSIHQWGVERFFHYQDVAALTNASRLPVLLEMTCLTASFQVPTLPTLDESLLRQPNGGARAVWGPSGFGYSAAHNLLASGFLDLFHPGARVNLGEAAFQGKLNLAAQATIGLDALDTFTLLGDPAANLYLDLPVYLPLIRR